MRNWLIKILQTFNILRFFNFNACIYINKKRFKVPLMGNTGTANLQVSESWMIDILQFVAASQTGKFVDVGVNIGQTLLKFKSVNSNYEYVGFEPNPHCVHYVTKLIKENSFEKTHIIPAGISSKCLFSQLYFTTGSITNSAASMVPDFREEKTICFSKYVPFIDIETIEKEIDLAGISILKIDVEGGELEVIKSFYRRIEEDHPVILLEVLPVYERTNVLRKERQENLEKLVKDLGYSIFRILKSNDKVVKLMEISSLGIHSDLELCDYMLVPHNRSKSFIKKFNG